MRLDIEALFNRDSDRFETVEYKENEIIVYFRAADIQVRDEGKIIEPDFGAKMK